MKKLVFILTIISFMTAISAQEFKSSYAIQNIKTGKNLRPYEAQGANGTRIVLYNHVDWKCMTWDFLHVSGNVYQLRNLFTHKTFQPSGKLVAEVKLEQQPLSKDTLQQWEFIKAEENTFYIKLKGAELYITPSSEQTNSDIVLNPLQKGLIQQWKLVEQHPQY